MSTLESLRQEKGPVYALLLEALSHGDPIGLIQTGAPPSEYVPEANRIFPRLVTIRSEDALQRVMHQVFTQMFDEEEAGPLSRYDQPAREFWDARKKLHR